MQRRGWADVSRLAPSALEVAWPCLARAKPIKAWGDRRSKENRSLVGCTERENSDWSDRLTASRRRGSADWGPRQLDPSSS